MKTVAVADVSQLFCDREGDSMFFGMPAMVEASADQFSVESAGMMQLDSELDYEEVRVVDVPVRAQDTGPSSGREVKLPVHVVDVPEPAIVNEGEIQLQELWSSTDPFGSVTVKDPDIYAGTDKLFSSKPSKFEISQKTTMDKFRLTKDGRVYTAPGYIPDFEKEAGEPDGDPVVVIEYSVVDTVSNVTADLTLGIRITNVEEPPYFDPPVQNFTINVGSSPGDKLGTVTAANEDFDDSVDVELLEQPKRLSDREQKFTLTLREDGDLLITPGSSYEVIDDDVGTWYAMNVRAIDNQGLEHNGTHFIEVTNPPERPKWTEPAEFSEGGSGRIHKSIQEHYEESRGVYQEFEPKCKDPNGRGYRFQLLDIRPRVFGDILEVDRQSGKLLISEPRLLDYETLKNDGSIVATLNLVCIDSFSLQTERVGTLELEVQNEPEPPRFVSGDFEYSVREDESTGVVIGPISAIDEDFDSAYELSFKLRGIGGSDDMPFETSAPVFEENGHCASVNLTLSSTLDYFSQSSYEFKIVVNDKNGNSDERVIDVEVEFVNTAPKFTQSTYQLSVLESVSSEDVLANLQDFPFNDRALVPSYDLEITWIDYPGLLHFDRNRLRLPTGRELNYERIWFHNFSIRITDAGGLSDEANVTLTVMNVNDLRIDRVTFLPHSTMGGSPVTIWGADLGPVWRSASVDAIIRAPGDAMILESPCKRQNGNDGLYNNTMLTCSVPAGVGTGLKWTLHVDGDSRKASTTTRFHTPVVDEIESWPTRALTSGGQSFIVVGKNFGPRLLRSSDGQTVENPVAVHYESNADRRVGVLYAAHCQVYETDIRINCSTVEGAGSELQFQASVGDGHPRWKQTSRWVFLDKSYAPPRIDVVTPLSRTLPTTGLPRALRFEGVNFGPSDHLIATTMSNDWAEWTPQCFRQNHTFLVCNLPEGLGENFRFLVNVADQESPMSPEKEAISYDPPVLDDVLNVVGAKPRDLNTQGNELIFLHGTNFGPGIGEDGSKMVLARYGRELEYRADDCIMMEPHVRIRCVTVEGIGKNHTWRATVGKQWSNKLTGVSNYHPPVVATYARPNSSVIGVQDMETPGNETIVIHGRYFGPAGTDVDEVRYGEGNITFTASPCHVLSHTKMHCVSAPGAGSGHFWAVQIGGQSSQIATTAYKEPSIHHFEGVDGTDPGWLRTTGGELIDVVGENFGPSEVFLEAVNYGPRADKYAAHACQVLDHDRIRCKTAPGHGQIHRWIVVIAGQRSKFSNATTSYAPPVIYDVSPSHGPTGFDKSRGSMPTLKINGSDLGLNLVQQLPVKLRVDTDGLLRKWKDQGKVEDSDDVLLRAFRFQQEDPASWLGKLDEGFPRDLMEEWLSAITSVDISSSSMYPIENASEYEQIISVELPEGFGINRPLFISVGDTFSLPVEFDYDPPRITQISPSIETINGDRTVVLTVFGKNFCGGSSCKGSECCGLLYVDGKPQRVPAENYFHDEIRKEFDDSDIKFTGGGRPTGKVQVVVLHQPVPTEERDFKDPIPEIPSQQGKVQLSGFRTEGGETFKLLQVKEVYQGYDGDDIDLKIGGEPCTNIRTYNTKRNSTTKTSRGDIECKTPPNIGKNLLVTLSVKKTDLPNPELEVDYSSPVICAADLDDDSPNSVLYVQTGEKCSEILGNGGRSLDVVPEQRIPTTGGTVIVEGDNFGSKKDISFEKEPEVSLRGLKKVVAPLKHHHHTLHVPIPPGAGVREAEFLVAEFGASGGPPAPGFSFKYREPSISRIYPSVIPTNAADGYTIYVFGDNFGPPTGAFRDDDSREHIPDIAVHFDIDGDGDYEEKCILVGSNHTVIQCHPPQGQGNKVQVRVTVDEQPTTTDDGGDAEFRYMAPDVAWMDPVSGPTSGKIDGEPVNVTIVGENFGLSGYVQFKGDVREALIYTHEKIVFRLPEGFGEDVSVFVVQDFWESRMEGSSDPIPFSYDPPVINAIEPVGGAGEPKDCAPIKRDITVGNQTKIVEKFPECFPTKGNVRIRVSGSNFGPGGRSPVVRLFISDFDGIGEESSSSNPHEMRFFTLPSGVGADLLTRICIAEPTTLQDEDCASGRLSDPNVNGSALISYDPPRIDTIMPNIPDATGEKLEFVGANFGPLGTELEIKLDNLTCLNPVMKRGHTIITCDMQTDVVGPKRIDMTLSNREKTFPAWLGTVIAKCKRGWYGLQGEMCLNCKKEEPGAVCPGGERFVDLIYAEEGWWRTNDTTPSERCHPKRQSREKCPVFLPCEPNRACTGNNTCAKQYAGFRCSDCADGYFRIAGLCQSCPDHAWLLAVMLGFGVIGVAIGGYIINAKGIRLAAFTIGIDYFQVLALFARTRVRWPMVMERTLQALSFFNLNLELAAPSCWMSPPPTFEVKWMATMAVPILAISLLSIIYVTRYFYKLVVLRLPSKLRHTHINAIIATAMVIMYVLYIFLVRRTLDIFNCAPTDPPDGNLYMAGRTDIVCWESPVHVNLLVPLATIALVVYVAAFPIFAFTLLKKNKENVKHDQILRAHGYGNSTLTNPNYIFRRRFQRLYHLFKPGKWYWVMFILMRKFLIALTALMFRSSPIYQLAMTLLVIFVSFVLQTRNQPYMASKDFSEIVRHHAKKVKEGDPMHMQIQSVIDATKAQNLKEAHKSYGWEAQQARMQSKRDDYRVSLRVIHYLTDFNTVEAILLSCAILVNLFGIMFLSSRFDEESMKHYRQDFETLGILAMLVVCFSVVYFIFVFIFEMLSTFYPNAALKCASACSCGGPTVRAAATEHGTNVKKMSRLSVGESRASFATFDNPLAVENKDEKKEAASADPATVRELKEAVEVTRAEIYELKAKAEKQQTTSSKAEKKHSKGSKQYTVYMASKAKRQFGQRSGNNRSRRALFGRSRPRRQNTGIS
eukprot:gb/GECG01004804.1/.p1 GENE.gb/GECG01004804.1/~~gb/GECG01004804.1/.p1  ORF type:complete len:2888 (+),score=298.40 gb/GECG01004804.1/:1-8664(+)